MEETKKEDVLEEEELIIFPEVQIGDIVVKPWSFGMLFDVSSLLDTVIERMDDKDIIINLEKEIIPYATIARIFTIASGEALEIICMTVEKSEEDIKKLPMEDGVKIAVVIARQNWETIKNAVAPLFKKKEEEKEEVVEQEKTEK